jgi:hypothetical protein
MAKTMKAAVVHAFGRALTVEQVPIPTPGPGQVLVRVVASGVCHTDLHAADGDWPVKPTLPHRVWMLSTLALSSGRPHGLRGPQCSDGEQFAEQLAA